MKRCSFREWIPILPWPVWPLAWQCSLGQNTVVGSMTILLAVRGNIATRSMSGPPFALQLHRTTVWCGATTHFKHDEYWPFYHVDFPYGKVVLTINTAHPFFSKVYEPLSRIVKSSLGAPSANGEDESPIDPQV